MKLTIIADCVIGCCRLFWNPIEIQGMINQFHTGNRSDRYALVQRQKSLAQSI